MDPGDSRTRDRQRDLWQHRNHARLRAPRPPAKAAARGFVSYGYGTTDKYKGEGKQDQHMVNAKGVIPVGEGQIDGWFSYSDRREQDYQDMSLDMLDRLGYDFDNTFSDYEYAILLADIGNNRGDTGAPVTNPGAGTIYPDDIETVDDAYYDASGLRKDTLAALGYSTPIGENRRLRDQGLLPPQRRHGPVGHALRAEPERRADLDPHHRIRHQPLGHFRFGRLHASASTTSLSAAGTNTTSSTRPAVSTASKAAPNRAASSATFRPIRSSPSGSSIIITDTLLYYVQDAIDLGRVKINLGWKGYRVTNRAEAIIQDVYPEGEFKTEDWFQPQRRRSLST